MKVAVICPQDFTVVLCCKAMVNILREYDRSEVYIISDINKEGNYSETIKSWGFEHIPVVMSRHINPFSDLKCLYSLYKILKSKEIDVVINACTKPNIYGAIAGRLAGIKKILCSVWGRGTAFLEDGGLKGNILKFLLLKLYYVAFHLSDKVWFTNTNDHDYFIAQKTVQPEKVILTKNYVDIEEFYPDYLPEKKLKELRGELGLHNHDKVVILVGRMIWSKGVGEFINASNILREKLPEIKFILVGPEEKTSPNAVPTSYLEESMKADNFQWLGWRNDVKDLYALSDLAVLPSYYREGGYPRALTEPMAMGKPVIAADSIDCRAPVEDGKNGYLVPIKDAQALADAIEILMSDDEKRKQFGRYSRLKTEREYDERIIVQQVINEFMITTANSTSTKRT
jgi:N,N'-diacetylbacillosaminyl-diphospho-undecaprenol alpha-1,3-N-acetylgalactosaminyltransferase